MCMYACIIKQSSHAWVRELLAWLEMENFIVAYKKCNIKLVNILCIHEGWNNFSFPLQDGEIWDLFPYYKWLFISSHGTLEAAEW